ncbi:MAG: CPBP family intramembrane glutamic endopeptidase [Chloroflexia bacterium]
MGLSELAVHPDWEVRAAQQEREQRRHLWAMLLVIGGTTLAMAAVEVGRRYLPDLAWHDFGIQAVSLCAYWAAVVWLAFWKERNRTALCLATLGVALTACAVGNFPLKSGLPATTHLSYSPRTADPRLLWGLGFFLTLPWLFWLYRRYPDAMRAAGLNAQGLHRQLLWGILAGAVLSAHLFFTASFSRAPLLYRRDPRYFLWILGYEAGLQTWAEELFFRGRLLAFLYDQRAWSFWKAAFVTSGLNLLLYLPKSEWRTAPLITLGLLFYTFVAGMIYAFLYRRFRSVWPSFIANLIFDLFAFVVY